MKIDYIRIGKAFPNNAWAYAEQYDCVKIGKWENGRFTFHQPLDEDSLIVLRIFDNKRELKFTGDKFRDTASYPEDKFIPELADVQYYYMYGEHAESVGDSFTKLWEERGGEIYFPSMLEFPTKNKKGEPIVALKLGIKNFVRYNCVPVLKCGQKYDEGINGCGSGALEVVDYAYTGFFYDNETAVKL